MEYYATIKMMMINYVCIYHGKNITQILKNRLLNNLYNIILTL